MGTDRYLAFRGFTVVARKHLTYSDAGGSALLIPVMFYRGVSVVVVRSEFHPIFGRLVGSVESPVMDKRQHVR
jgi:hypothetical protein